MLKPIDIIFQQNETQPGDESNHGYGFFTLDKSTLTIEDMITMVEGEFPSLNIVIDNLFVVLHGVRILNVMCEDDIENVEQFTFAYKTSHVRAFSTV